MKPVRPTPAELAAIKAELRATVAAATRRAVLQAAGILPVDAPAAFPRETASRTPPLMGRPVLDAATREYVRELVAEGMRRWLRYAEAEGLIVRPHRDESALDHELRLFLDAGRRPQ